VSIWQRSMQGTGNPTSRKLMNCSSKSSVARLCEKMRTLSFLSTALATMIYRRKKRAMLPNMGGEKVTSPDMPNHAPCINISPVGTKTRCTDRLPA
jgi:hypothetical protein